MSSEKSGVLRNFLLELIGCQPMPASKFVTKIDSHGLRLGKTNFEAYETPTHRKTKKPSSQARILANPKTIRQSYHPA